MHAKLEHERARSVATAACAACTVGFLFMRQRAIRGAIAKMLTVRVCDALYVCGAGADDGIARARRGR